MTPNQEVSDFLSWYGDGADGSSPTKAQWQRIFSRPSDAPLTLINFFKFREYASYESAEPATTGAVAFQQYAAISVPTMEKAGGEFLFVGPSLGAFLGNDEDWDLIAIGRYPNLAAFVSLYGDEGYRGVFQHRIAACERQKVLIGIDS